MARFAGKKVSDFMSASNSPNFDALGDYTMRSRNKEQDMAWRAQAHVAKAGVAGVGNTQVAKFKGIADIASAEADAAAQKHNAAAAAGAQTSNAMWGMAGSIGGAGMGAIGKAGGLGGYSGTGPDIGANEATNKWADPGLAGMSPAEVAQADINKYLNR